MFVTFMWTYSISTRKYNKQACGDSFPRNSGSSFTLPVQTPTITLARYIRYSYIAKGTSFRERNIHFAKGTFISRKEDFVLRKEDIVSNLNG